MNHGSHVYFVLITSALAVVLAALTFTFITKLGGN